VTSWAHAEGSDTLKLADQSHILGTWQPNNYYWGFRDQAPAYSKSSVLHPKLHIVREGRVNCRC
jgi:hypothetical protein